MSLKRHLTRGLRVLFHPAEADQDLTDEVQDYLERSAAAKVERGLTPEEALREARLELGNVTVTREQVRSYGWENAVSVLMSDLRYAARQLRANPTFAAVGVLTLGLGIGASTAIFSAVNPILFEPLPYPAASRLFMISDLSGTARPDVAFHTYREVAARTRAFDAVTVMRPWQPAMTGSSLPERLDGQSVSWNWSRVLGVAPALGRTFEESEDQVHGPRVAILSDHLWRRRFGADRTIIGRQITLDDNLYTVIGVMPAFFENVMLPSAEIWTALQYDARNITNSNTREWGKHLKMLGRARPGVTEQEASQDLRAIALHPVPEFPRPRWAALESGLGAASLQDEVTRGIRPAMLAVLAAVLILLLIASVNVTSLLLARGAQRHGEFAMRAALGAGRSRLIRQLVTEGLLLSMLGGALGVAAAGFGVRLLIAICPSGLPRLSAISINAQVFGFALAITTLVGVVAGLIPAWQVSRNGFSAGLQRGSRRASGGHQMTRRVLVISEVALAMMLLLSAGLLLRSFDQLLSVPVGFDAAHLLAMQVQETGHRFADDDAARRFFAQSVDAVRRVPGVAQAAYTSLLPLSGEPDGAYGVTPENGDGSAAYRYAVTPGYFEAMGLALRRGRYLNERDVAGAPWVVVISESLAQSRFRGQEPLGKRIHVGPTARPYYSVVGVVGDVKQPSLAQSRPEAVYLTSGQSWFADNTMWLVARLRDDVSALPPSIKNAIWSVDKDQPIERVGSMHELLIRSESERRFVMIVFEAFALAALILAATGIYGVLSAGVAERTREIGVRAALGASRGSILALVLRQGLALTGLGVAIGLVCTTWTSRVLASLLFGISQFDLFTHGAVIGLLVIVAAGACWLPAWRAARVDPAVTLRAE